MPNLSAAELRERLQSDMPGVVAVPAPEPSATAGEGKPAKAKPNLLATNDVIVVAEKLPQVVCYLTDVLGYTYLSDLAVVDYLADGLFEVVYRFYHLNGGSESLVLKVRVPRDKPTIPSLTPQLPGADLNEREAFDLFGINFVGHPYLKRIYMWDEFVGHPMRKDFPRQGDKYLGGSEE